MSQSEWFKLDYSSVDELQKYMDKYGSRAAKIIGSVFFDEGGKEIIDNITRILPASGRKWRKKKSPAKNAQPFTQIFDTLSITTVSRGHYHYLYFPDDGSNTLHHAGNQQFMRRGAENSSEKIINLCLGKLTENFK